LAKSNSKTDLTLLEKGAYGEGKSLVAGLDEAGRGPLAGPVVAGAVVFPESFINSSFVNSLGINDSKKLTEKKRHSLIDDIHFHALSVGVGVVWPEGVDSLNIHNASLKAMELALVRLTVKPDIVLVDGAFTIKEVTLPQMAIKGGDGKSVSIAAASIIAKTTRDNIMKAYDYLFPEYGFAGHKGYGTKAHREAIKKHGATPIHRKSFSWG